MKGNYNIRKLSLFCILLCGITATVETIIMFLGVGKISMISLVAAVSFFLFLILWAIQEVVKTPDIEKSTSNLSSASQSEKKSSQTLSAGDRNPMQDKEMVQKKPETLPSHTAKIYSLSTDCQNVPTTQTLQPCQPSYIDYTQQQYQEIQLYQEQQISRFIFSIENLSKIYDFSWEITNEERKNMLKKFLDKKYKLELTEKAKSEVHNLQKNTALLTITNDGGAEFFLYDNSYLVPSLETYLSWYRRSYDSIKEELQDRMLNYIFSFEPQNVLGNMSITRLQPAKVTKVGNKEYLIEERNRGILFFGNMN